MITGYKGSDTEVIIPAEIDGKPVTAISFHAFGTGSGIDDITFPDSVREIPLFETYDSINLNIAGGTGAPFSNYSYWLEKKREEDPLVIINNIVIDGTNCSRDVEIPEGVTCIAPYAFIGCSTITSISLPESLEIIGDAAFVGCSRLTDIVIPDSVNKIGTLAFDYCKALENVTFPNNTVEMGINIFANNYYDSPWLINKMKENPLVIVNGNLINGYFCTGDVVIPDSVKSIPPYAFSGSGVNSVQLPNGMTKIPDGLFANSGIKNITIPDSVTEIGNYAFSGSHLTNITIPSSVTVIGCEAFYDCDNLTSVTLSEGLKIISSRAFDSIYNLTELTLPDSIESVAKGAFYRCDITYKGEVYFPELYDELYAAINGQ